VADYYTKFSIAIGPLTLEEKDWLEKEIHALDARVAEADDFLGFDSEFQVSDDKRQATLWIHDNDGNGDTEQVAELCHAFVKHFNLPPISLEYSCDCSKPRLDTFGGGAFVASKDSVQWISTSQWVQETIEREQSRA
jgi:hypothetical protein